MQVTIDLPDDISEALRGQGSDLPQQALEALAIEGYRAGALTESQVRRLLGFDSRFDVHAILKNHGVALRYTESDLQDDLTAHRELGIPRGR